MTIEEKAKAYDNAVINGSRLWECGGISRENYEYIFSELKESEDERIRKEIISFIQDHIDEINLQVSGDYDTRDKEDIVLQEWCKKALAWLEKQKEPELSEDLGEYVTELSKQFPEVSFAKLSRIAVRVKNWLEKQGESYTKRDVDDAFVEGMVYAKSELEKQGERKVADKIGSKFNVGDWVFIEEVKGYKNGPFQIKSVDSFGYSFDEYHTIPFMYEELLSKWTIQDAKDGDVLYHKAENGIEYIVMSKGLNEHNNIDSYFRYNSIDGFSIDIPSVLSAKYDSITPATKEQRDLLLKKMHEAGYTFDFEKKELTKLKFRVGDEVITENEESLTITRIDEEGYWSNDLFICNFDEECIWDLVEQKSALSEYDELNLKQAIYVCHQNEYTAVENWLKSLKDRIRPIHEFSDTEKQEMFIRSQRPHFWRPSEKQMEVLLSEVTAWTKGCHKQKVLESLYNDLKNLKA